MVYLVPLDSFTKWSKGESVKRGRGKTNTDMVEDRVLRGKVFGTPTPYCPVIFALTQTGPKNSKFYGPDPGPTRLYFPRTGQDRNNLASTPN